MYANFTFFRMKMVTWMSLQFSFNILTSLIPTFLLTLPLQGDFM
jgi:hypothetical protein